MKSKKSKKSKYSKQDLDRSIQPTPTPKLCGCGNTEHLEGHCDGSHKVKKEPRKMINRRAIQAEIDKDKKIRALLATNYYNINQIAAMLGLHAERVKKVKDAKTGE